MSFALNVTQYIHMTTALRLEQMEPTWQGVAVM